MMKRKEGLKILLSQVGNELTDGKIQSFYLNNQLVDQVNVLFLKFEKWIHVCLTEELCSWQIKEIEPNQIQSWQMSDGSKFEFPLVNLLDSTKNAQDLLGKRLTKVTELIDQKTEVISGLKFYFEDYQSLALCTNYENETFILFENRPLNGLLERRI